jgi:hypothetical protein
MAIKKMDVNGALLPLNFSRVQNLIADNPSGKPSDVTARPECIRIPHTLWYSGRVFDPI